ncbi:MAG TPA: RraA family protein [Rhodopila sp.]|uniref:RraA family protein n=1 Tax=Rhodopila sp. TaxID=2480087 RepID=UPI002CB98F5C|nr:RraA family protein [Rhodopila sp.]HVY14471.1 RraA family protein [Rhodopila sp.]
MFTVRPLPPQIDPALLALLAKAEPATIGHFRHTGFVDPAIKALQKDVRIAGTAVTVQSAGPDSTIVHFALGQIRPGDIMVIDRCGDHKHAITGGAVIYAAKHAGVAGVVIDGMATDFQELREFGVPVWCRGTTPVTGKMLGLGGGFCIPVSCGGVAVNPGDAIVADENGVLVLPPADIERDANRAIAMQKEEKEVTFKRIEAGEKIGDISGATKLILSKLAP